MNVYAPLQSYLANHADTAVVMTYAEIESLLGRKLPPTAYGSHKRQWWANTETHSQALAWLKARRKARLDVVHDRVTFTRHAGSFASSARQENAGELLLQGLLPSARRMLEDVAEERGLTVEAAATALLNQSALKRRAATLDWFATNTRPSSISSVEMLRNDRDGH